MAERQKLIHLHSSVVKVPSVGTLEKGEIAVQYAAEDPAIYMEDSDNNVVKFISSGAVANAIAVEAERAKGIEDSLDGRIDTLESLSGQSHTHDNLAVLSGITAEKVAAWDAAEQNAKDYADQTFATSAATVAEIEAAKVAASGYAVTAQDEAVSSAKAYTDAMVNDATDKINTLSAETIGLSASVIANYATSADTVSELESAGTYLSNLASGYAVTAQEQAIASAKEYTDAIKQEFIDGYADSAHTYNAIEDAKASASGMAVEAQAQAVASAKEYTDAEISNASGNLNNLSAATVALSASVVANYATSADTVAEIEATKALASGYSLTAEIEAVASSKSYTDAVVKTLNDNVSGLSASTVALSASVVANYATSADTKSAIDAVDAKFADYATSAAVVSEFAKYATSADTHSAISAVSGKVVTLVGEDEGKSVRTVAAEEVAKVVASADTKFDTLKEIADWIQNDTTGAAKMANDIADLKAISADTRLDALEAISGQSHTHDNLAVLSGITAEKVAAWDAAEQNAKDYTDEKLKDYATSSDTKNAIDALSANVVSTYATSADTNSAIENVDARFAYYATSADTKSAIDTVDAKFADYATSADTYNAIASISGTIESELSNYATSADTVAAIESLSGNVVSNYVTSAILVSEFAKYATSADTVAAIDAVDAKFADYATSAAVVSEFAKYATSADTKSAIDAVDAKFADYATSADTKSAIDAVDAKFADYATSADTVSAIDAVDAKFADYATSADTKSAIDAVDAKFADYATSADTVSAIDALSASVVTNYATSADTVSAIDALSASVVTNYATSADTVNAINTLKIDCGEY